ncbi:citrate synthase [Flexivirga oryzae]|uniref:citrate synthase (unknown stereospecificity) n=1 Tax=Flexivirga oryzae TaxID=1794944 RepID=A0A839N3P2_9MICO|nr:citrate synthase [Flexivirga oryzae]MBB2892358.1 citrate synthase [Flexivirga oryzae]
MDGDLITTAQAADLLGVRIPTIYSYVSRGLLHPADVARSRHDGSVFPRGDVIALVEARRRPRRGHFEMTIETAVTSVEPSGVLLYRGLDVAELATTHPFEEVAEIVWGGADDGCDWPTPELAPPPPGRTPRDLILWAIAETAVTDHARNDLSSGHFRDAGRRSIRAAAASLASVNRGSTIGRIAEIVGGALAARAPAGATVDALDVALGLLADHELATSTLAARAAASTGADPYAVLTAGVAALGGVRHGSASGAAYDVLRTVLEGGTLPAEVVAGFGHTVYADTDPRAIVLLDRVAGIDDGVAAATDRLALHLRRLSGLAPNVDLGLAALSLACDLPRHTGEVVFTIARLAGFVAHGIEEQGHPLRFRARATYTGAASRSTSGPT